MMASEWFRRIFKSGWRGSNALSPVPKTGGLPIFPHPVIFFISHHNHVCMSTFAYINPWYEPMAGNAPASMLYENTVLLLNYTGIDAHTVKQHGSSIMISCAHSFIPLTGKQRISMHPCRDDIVSWMEFESMAFWFGIKCSIPLSYQDDKSGEQDWTLPAMNEEMETLSASYWFIPRVRLSTGWLSPRVRFTSHFRMLVPPSP